MRLSLACRTSQCFTLLWLLCQTPGVAATPEAAGGAFPLTQTSGAYTLTATGARWARLAEVQPWRKFTKPADRARRVLFVQGQVSSSAPVALPPGDPSRTTLRDYAEAEAVGPQGQRVKGSPTDSSVQPGGWTWDDLDPRWETYRLEFTLKEPSAPKEAGGKFVEKVSLDGVPLPGEPDTPLHWDHTVTTALGTKLVFDGVRWGKLPKSMAARRELHLTFTLVPPPSAPDLRIDLEPAVAVPAIVDDRGEDISTGNWLCAPTFEPRHYDLRLHTRAPSAQAKSVNLRLRLEQDAPNLRQHPLFHPFAFTLPGRSIGAAPAETPVMPAATVSAGPLNVTVESVTTGVTTGHTARVWVRDREEPQPWSRAWRIAGVTLVDPQGKRLVMNGYNSAATGGGHLLDSPLHWKLDGTAPRQDETGFEINFDTSFFTPAPDRLSLALHMEQVARDYSVLNMTDLPVPALGGVAVVDRTVDVPGRGRYVLAKVGNFDAGHPLSAYNGAHRRDGSEYDPALYVVIAFIPATPGPAPGVQQDTLGVVDDRGGVLRHEEVQPTFGGSDQLAGPGAPTAPPAGSNAWMTLTLAPASPGAKTFALHWQFTQTTPTGKAADVVLKDIPLAPLEARR